jgi:LysM repeat protein
MNRILACLILIAGLGAPAVAQDAALVERVNRLTTYVEDLLQYRVDQQKQITELEREVKMLRKQLADASGGASREDVIAVADAVKQLEQKHKADIELIATKIEGLGKTTGPTKPRESVQTYTQGWEYTIQQGNTLSAIAKAYRAKNIKVSVDDILKANPGLDANRLKVGDVIFIPEP